MAVVVRRGEAQHALVSDVTVNIVMFQQALDLRLCPAFGLRWMFVKKVLATAKLVLVDFGSEPEVPPAFGHEGFNVGRLHALHVEIVIQYAEGSAWWGSDAPFWI